MKVWELLPIFFKQKGLSLPTCRFAKLVGLQNLLISKTNYYFSWIDALVVKVRVQVNLPGRSQDLFLLLCVTLIYPYPCLSFCLTHSCLSVCLPVSVLHTQTHTHTYTHSLRRSGLKRLLWSSSPEIMDAWHGRHYSPIPPLMANMNNQPWHSFLLRLPLLWCRKRTAHCSNQQGLPGKSEI